MAPLPVLVVVCGLSASGCASSPGGTPAAGEPLELVDSVDLRRYEGLWYEIARLPNSFQDHCRGGVTAEYTLRADGRVDVLNRCPTVDGGVDSARGLARRPDPDRPATFEVRFAPAWLSWLPAVWGDYQIMALSDGYWWAMVGSPSRKFLWILAREPRLEEDRIRSLLAEAERQGFPAEEVRRTPHEVP